MKQSHEANWGNKVTAFKADQESRVYSIQLY